MDQSCQFMFPCTSLAISAMRAYFDEHRVDYDPAVRIACQAIATLAVLYVDLKLLVWRLPFYIVTLIATRVDVFADSLVAGAGDQADLCRNVSRGARTLAEWSHWAVSGVWLTDAARRIAERRAAPSG